MIILLKKNPHPQKLGELITQLETKGIRIQKCTDESRMLLVLFGNTSQLDTDRLSALEIVDEVKQIQEPYRLASRKFHPQDTVIRIGNTEIGGGGLTLIAGPCSVESDAQIIGIAKAVKASGATLLRGGAFKPRTSPYSFQGLGADGIALLKLASQETGLPIVSEIMEPGQLPLFRDVDILQVGARNMQNFALLRALGQQDKPVLLKRGLAATYEEWLMSAEYIMNGGNQNVILCERGIRTFEPYTRNTLDISAVPVLHQLTHLPVIVDPSHAAGRSALVEPLACAAVAAGADGLLIEVHNDPELALSDGSQSLRPEAFELLSHKLFALHHIL